MEEIINLLTQPAVQNILIGIIVYVLTTFYKNTIFYKVLNILADAFIEILDETDLEVPEKIEELIMKIHATSEDTQEIENLFEDKKVKKSK
ncbi:MAG: hypothetical protein ACQEQD_04475 [Bacillota bacterium]